MTVTETSPAADVDSAPAAVPAEEPGPDHRTVGTACLLLGLFFLLVAGVLALVLRTQLARPNLHVVGRRPYEQLLTLHGAFAVFLFLFPAWIGVAFAVVPGQLGAGRLSFPRAASLTFWLFVVAGGLIVASALVKHGVPAHGWSLDATARNVRGRGVDLYILGIGTASVAALLGAVNLLVTVLKRREPGLSLRRAPLFSWSVVVSSSVLLLAIPALLAGLTLLFLDHHLHGRAFDPTSTGDPLVWRELFWFFAYPALWALVLPGLGAICEIVPVFARAPLFRRRETVVLFAAVAPLAFAGFGAEVVDDKAIPRTFFRITGLFVLGPIAAVLLGLLATLAGGLRGAPSGDDGEASPARPAFTSPLVHALGLVIVLGIGLLGMAVMTLAATGRAGHGSYWWVGAWHSVILGGSVIGLLAALHYWSPRLWGRYVPSGPGNASLGLVVVGVLLTFVPMFVLGIQEMHRRTAVYTKSSLGPANLIATAGAYLLALGLVGALAAVAGAALGRGPAVDGEPWATTGLEPPR